MKPKEHKGFVPKELARYVANNRSKLGHKYRKYLMDVKRSGKESRGFWEFAKDKFKEAKE